MKGGGDDGGLTLSCCRDLVSRSQREFFALPVRPKKVLT